MLKSSQSKISVVNWFSTDKLSTIRSSLGNIVHHVPTAAAIMTAPLHMFTNFAEM